MLEEQYDRAKETGAGVVMCGLKYDISLKSGEVLYKESSYKDVILTERQKIKDIILDILENTLFNYTHNKLYQLKLLKDNDIKFIEWMRIDEDTNFNIDVLGSVSRLALNTHSYYHYIRTFEETAVTKYYADNMKIRELTYRRLIELFRQLRIYTEENQKLLSSMYIHQIINNFEMYFHRKCPLTVKEKNNRLKQQLTEKMLLKH